MTILQVIPKPSSDTELEVHLSIGKTVERLTPIGTLTVSVKEYYLLRSVLESARIHNPNMDIMCPHLEEIYSAWKKA